MGFFVIRAKRNLRFGYLDSHPVDRATGVHSDQTIRLYGFYSQRGYPERFRRIRLFDTDKRKWLVFLTKNFTLPALTIAQLYKCRWQIELFFKWLKQHLRIKAVYGPPRTPSRPKSGSPSPCTSRRAGVARGTDTFGKYRLGGYFL